ncbi:aminotransferase class V-fold PLP-dependent enzyme [Pseudomonas akapageensis]|uniref:aminotransferase class V-fold PLP-dependent enzyme n=1 Tax=Pseudomonas akapageensis TaxID=2609961 RepID=UPI0014081668|nr:aminotransferase class V-fold PLP-dependent enzyme [Pseudomonas akapageensis]
MSTCPALHDANTLARDEGYWQRIAADYEVEPGPINFEYGYFGRMTRTVAEQYQQNIAFINRSNSLHVRQQFEQQDNLRIHAALAELVQVAPETVALTQSASAALQSLIRNYNAFKPGDQVLISDLEYDSIQNAMRWLARNRGVEVIEISHPHPASHDSLLQSYESALLRYPRLKLMVLTHVTHRTGLVMPVQAIAAKARAAGVDVVLDGAHALGQLDFRLDELGVAFAGYNLQKWMGAPLSLGVIYIQQDRLQAIDPDMAALDYLPHSIQSRTPYGTPNIPAWLTLPTVFAEHQAMGGSTVKGARLKYLRDLWVSQVQELDGIEVLTPDDPRLYSAITSFRFTRHADQQAMAQRLLDEYNLFTVVRAGSACGPCIRVTPGFTTTLEEVRVLVGALAELSR